VDIKVLSPEVIDQIAAGEVVERPAHLVKELLENSLDALSSKIEIDVEDGGRKIKISDDGIGISRDDLPLAVARHATSKISKSDDLWTLNTFGFRGEALASISSVSRMKIVSRKKSAEKAFAFESNYGVTTEPLMTGAGPGTTIEIGDLFANVPARLKFLKSDSAEITQIKNVVKALALANPTVEFKFKQQSKVIFYYPADSNLQERAKRVLETPDLFTVHTEYQGYKLEATLSSPHTTTGNGKQIWIFVQNRWVQDRTVQAAVMEAYRSLLMHGEYPFAVLKIQVPDGNVDVNIHPTKSQVKFTDQSFIFRFVHNAVRAELEKGPWLGTLDRQKNIELAVQDYSENNLKFQDTSFAQTQYMRKSFSPASSAESNGEPRVLPERFRSDQDGSEDLVRGEALGTPRAYIEVAKNFSSEQVPEVEKFWSGLEVIGQSYLTYILAEGNNSLFLIDQHAAHERVAFERLMANWKDGKFEIQDFLLPVELAASADQVEALLGVTAEFERMGLRIEQGGPELIFINSSPNFISEKGLVAALKKFAEDVVNLGGSFSFEKKIADIFATMACHSVVRAGQALSKEEMKSLLVQMDEFRLSSYCPHGRNVFVEMPFYKIEKDFGRIQ